MTDNIICLCHVMRLPKTATREHDKPPSGQICFHNVPVSILQTVIMESAGTFSPPPSLLRIPVNSTPSRVTQKKMLML